MVRADPASTEAPAATVPGPEGAPALSGSAQETVKVTQYISYKIGCTIHRCYWGVAV